MCAIKIKLCLELHANSNIKFSNFWKKKNKYWQHFLLPALPKILTGIPNQQLRYFSADDELIQIH